MSIIAILPARGGSVRIPRKNIRLFRGKPMIEYAIEAAKKSDLFDAIVVSTDDQEIAHTSMNTLVSELFIHERKKDNGTRGTQEIARQVLRAFDKKAPGTESVCIIYPCSPLLTPTILRESYQAFVGTEADYLVSVNPSPLSDAGCFYWCNERPLMRYRPLYVGKTIAYAIPHAIDINTENDWLEAERMYDEIHS